MFEILSLDLEKMSAVGELVRANLSPGAETCCIMQLFSTLSVGLHHSMGVDHLSDQLHCVVQQFCCPDLSPGSGFSLFKLGQQVTGSQCTFRQRLLHPANMNSFVVSATIVPYSCGSRLSHFYLSLV